MTRAASGRGRGFGLKPTVAARQRQPLQGRREGADGQWSLGDVARNGLPVARRRFETSGCACSALQRRFDAGAALAVVDHPPSRAARPAGRRPAPRPASAGRTVRNRSCPASGRRVRPRCVSSVRRMRSKPPIWPLCMNDQRPDTKGWQLARLVAPPVEARHGRETAGADLPAQALQVGSDQPAGCRGRGRARPVAIPGEAEAVAIGRRLGFLSAMALGDQRMAGRRDDVFEEDFLPEIGRPPAHGLSAPVVRPLVELADDRARCSFEQKRQESVNERGEGGRNSLEANQPAKAMWPK